jgi:thiol-disulfide isomerase/thioredoxin
MHLSIVALLILPSLAAAFVPAQPRAFVPFLDSSYLSSIDSSPPPLPPPKRKNLAPFQGAVDVSLQHQQLQQVAPPPPPIKIRPPIQKGRWAPGGQAVKAKVFTVNEPKDLIEFLGQDDRICVVKVWAKWCKTCHAFDLRFKKYANNNDQVRFGDIEFVANEELCRGLGATKLPYILIYKNMIKQKQFVCLPHEFKKLIANVDQVADGGAPPPTPTRLP